MAREEVERVVARNSKPGSPILSVYLDVDPTREVNRQRGFEPALKNLLRSIKRQLTGERERKEFEANAGRVMRFVSGYKPAARSLVVFGRESDGFFWQRELQAPLHNDARWDDSPYLRPLMEVMNDSERCGIILADKARQHLERRAGLEARPTDQKTALTESRRETSLHAWNRSHRALRNFMKPDRSRPRRSPAPLWILSAGASSAGWIACMS